MRISDWSSDVCSSDLLHRRDAFAEREDRFVDQRHQHAVDDEARRVVRVDDLLAEAAAIGLDRGERLVARGKAADQLDQPHHGDGIERSEEHTSALQSLMRISYAVFCLQKQTSTT